MRRGAAIGIAFAAIAFAGLAASSPAGAAPNDRPGRALFERAESKFNVGRFDEALVDYQAAYEIEPLPAFLFNIGQCYRNMGDYERAQFFFRRYTALDPRSPNRPAAERLIAEMDRLVGEQAGPGETAEDARAPSSTSIWVAPASAAGGHAPAAQPAASLARPDGDRPAPPPLYRRPWVWAAAAAVVVGGVVAGFALTRDDPRSSLHPIDTR
jgi:tetratricopeptide (TPR) repeat protein